MIRKKKHIYLSLVFIILGLGIVFGVSYYTLRSLTLAGERFVYGNSITDLAQEIRDELLKHDNFKAVSFNSADKLKLSGVLIKRENPSANVILCHGFQGSKEFMYGYIDMLSNCNLLLFDFRAHGKSEGSMTSIGVLESQDVIGAARYMKEAARDANGKKLPLIILGISMGGAATLKAAELAPDLCDVLIVDSVFCTLRRVMSQLFRKQTGLPHYPFFTVITRMFNYFLGCDLDKMSLIKSVKKIKSPILFIHSCNDSFIEPRHCLKLYENANVHKTKLWVGPKCPHGWMHTYYPELYKRKLTKFLSKHLPKISIDKKQIKKKKLSS